MFWLSLILHKISVYIFANFTFFVNSYTYEVHVCNWCISNAMLFVWKIEQCMKFVKYHVYMMSYKGATTLIFFGRVYDVTIWYTYPGKTCIFYFFLFDIRLKANFYLLENEVYLVIIKYAEWNYSDALFRYLTRKVPYCIMLSS